MSSPDELVDVRGCPSAGEPSSQRRQPQPPPPPPEARGVFERVASTWEPFCHFRCVQLCLLFVLTVILSLLTAKYESLKDLSDLVANATISILSKPSFP